MKKYLLTFFMAMLVPAVGYVANCHLPSEITLADAYDEVCPDGVADGMGMKAAECMAKARKMQRRSAEEYRAALKDYHDCIAAEEARENR